MSWSELRFPAIAMAVAAGITASAVGVSMQNARKMRDRVESLRSANEFLRKTLGDMTIAVTEKNKELDRLAQTPCLQGNAPPVRKGNGKS